MTLFSQNEKANAPLADRMRPRTLDEFYGQEHIVGKGKLLRRAIEADRLTSCIFYGPPGCGKTTLAGIIAHQTHSAFIKMNAVTSGVSDVREQLKQALYKQICEAEYESEFNQDLGMHLCTGGSELCAPGTAADTDSETDSKPVCALISVLYSNNQ